MTKRGSGSFNEEADILAQSNARLRAAQSGFVPIHRFLAQEEVILSDAASSVKGKVIAMRRQQGAALIAEVAELYGLEVKVRGKNEPASQPAIDVEDMSGLYPQLATGRPSAAAAATATSDPDVQEITRNGSSKRDAEANADAPRNKKRRISTDVADSNDENRLDSAAGNGKKNGDGKLQTAKPADQQRARGSVKDRLGNGKVAAGSPIKSRLGASASSPAPGTRQVVLSSATRTVVAVSGKSGGSGGGGGGGGGSGGGRTVTVVGAKVGGRTVQRVGAGSTGSGGGGDKRSRSAPGHASSSRKGRTAVRSGGHG